MASTGAVFRCSGRMAGAGLGSAMKIRGFRSIARSLEAHNFAMPAMSPTMTEGNIARWKVKEGDSFTAGDILLEIETDKAQMEVEAQDDGVMAKIIQGDGAQSVKVGSRIAVLADPGDDPSTISIPPEESSTPASPQDETASGVSRSESSENMAEAPPTSKPSTTPAYIPHGKSSSSSPSPSPSSEAKSRNQSYPLYPSVQHILRQHGLSEEDASKIPATGPRGRLLKGDVLSYVGSIEKSYASELSARVSRLGHLDLSNIRPAAPKEPAKAAEAGPSPSDQAAAPSLPSLPSVPEPPVTVALPISLDKVQHVQRRVHKVLGISLPLSTFLSRATDLANRDLPATTKKASSLSGDELFDQILGLDAVLSTARTSFGRFVPEITALPSDPLPGPPINGTSSEDIYDILTGDAARNSTSTRLHSTDVFLADPDPSLRGRHTNLITVSVPDRDERHRAQTFLGRVKTILELEPGRLIL